MSDSFARPHELPRWLRPLGVFTLLAFVAAQAIAVLISPADRDMGHLQKIMYVHVPSAWSAFLAFGIVFLASVLYLWKRKPEYDLFAAAGAEVGTVLTVLMIAQGSIWGRPTWGVWWTWDPRLTTSAILLLIFAGYLALRAFTEEEERRARWSAAVGILGFINVPIVYMSVRWWRTIHQPQSTVETVYNTYLLGFFLNLAVFTLLTFYFTIYRYQVAQLERAAEAKAEQAALSGGGAYV